MVNGREQSTGVGGAGDRAVALFQSLARERQEHPIPRPALSLRFTSRLVDWVIYSLVSLVILSALRSAFPPPPDPAGGDSPPPWDVTDPNAFDDLVVWGPVGIDRVTWLSLGLVFVATVALEVIQTRALGATLGKRLNRIRVTGVGGRGDAAPRQMTVRGAVLNAPFVVVVVFWFASVLYAWTAAAILIANAVAIRRNSEQRGFHDRFARTEVFSTDVRVEAPRGSRS
ncbi:MAG: RDD family protein [Dehalococcoidia bacterium]